MELGRTSYAVRVVRPWVSKGRRLGYVELGTDIDSFLIRLARLTGDEYGMLLDKGQLDRGSWQRVSGRPERWEERSELLEVGQQRRRRVAAGRAGADGPGADPAGAAGARGAR